MKPAVRRGIVHLAQPPRQHAHAADALLNGLLGGAQRVDEPVDPDTQVVTNELIALDARVVLGGGSDGESQLRSREGHGRGGREAVLFEDFGLDGRRVWFGLRLGYGFGCGCWGGF